MRKLVNSIFGNIYYATVNEKTGTISSTNRVDATDDVIQCAFQWFMDKMRYGDGEKSGPLSEYQITFENCAYVLTMTKKQDANKEG